MDTLTVQKAFVDAGFTPEKAENLTRAIKDNQEVTKEDIHFLDKKIDGAEFRLKEEIHTLDKKIDGVEFRLKEEIHTLDKKIDGAEFRLKEEIHTLDKKIERTSSDIRLLKWMVSGLITLITPVLTGMVILLIRNFLAS